MAPGVPSPGTSTPYLQFTQDWVVLDPGEQHPHGVGAVVKVGYASTVQVTGQLVDVCL